MKISEIEEAKLLGYLKLYDEFDKQDKKNIYFLVYKNHLRYLKEMDLGQFNHYFKYLDKILNKDTISFDKPKSESNINSIRELTELFNEYMKDTSDFMNSSMSFNRILVENGLCPMCFYAFNNLIVKYPIDDVTMRKVIEFTIMTLYRIVKFNSDSKTVDKVIYNDTGAISDIYIDTAGKKTINKIPKTVASFQFLIEQEYLISQKLCSTELFRFIAGNYEFDYDSKIIRHDFIEGKDGEYYLFNHIKLTNEQVYSLRIFYTLYSKIWKEIILDLHPGNFVWDESIKSWIIVDLGAIPEIGSDYYVFDTFEEYYNNIWLNREMTMKKIPIRSMDFALDFDVKSKEVII